jgi:carboxymethylenebutenolidase
MTQKRARITPHVLQNVYLAQPGTATGSGVLVLHAWWGLTQFAKTFCDRLAQERYVVLAPDLYHGATATSIEEAKKLRSKLHRDVVAEEIRQATDHLLTICGSGKRQIGVIGFSLGGHWALWLADQSSSPVAATVVFYGARNGEYARSQSAFQFHLAETDDYVAASAVKKMKRGLEAAGREAEFFVYPGTTHWFFESDQPDAYHAEASALAWTRLVGLLQRHLP